MIGAIEETHFDKILKLNADFVHWLAPLDAGELRALLKSCIYARQIGEGDAVLIAIGSQTEVAGHSNLSWLKAQRDNFIYIDRVIVSAAGQGKGYGRALYEDLTEFARTNGYDSLACEVNSVPDNPGSHAFHLRQGYQTIGEQQILGTQKRVRYYAKALN